MPHFFFNIFGSHDVFDTAGTDLESAREVRIHMIAVAYALLETEHMIEGDWEMEVLDERGRIVASMDFSAEAKRA